MNHRQFKYILLAAALPVELAPILEKIEVESSISGPGRKLHMGSWNMRRVIALQTGAGSKRAADAVGSVLDAFEVSAILVLGLAGAVAPDLSVGAIVIPDKVASVENLEEKLLPDPLAAGVVNAPEVAHGGLLAQVDRPYGVADKTGLKKSGVTCVDMESYTIAALARWRGVRVSVVRSISDDADFDFGSMRYQSDGGFEWDDQSTRAAFETAAKTAARTMAEFLDVVFHQPATAHLTGADTSLSAKSDSQDQSLV